MGLFFNTCHALVDKITKRALTGDALEKARNDPSWPVCGNKVFRFAHFCSACGSPAPGGWRRCPKCGKWIGNDSHFCPHCSAALYPSDHASVAGGAWRKGPELFAQRFEVGDVHRSLWQGLQVQEGTVAILMSAGGVKDVVREGLHRIESDDPSLSSVVIVDASEVIVPVHIDSLRTSEHIPIEFYGEIVLRFKGDKDAAKAFCGNLLKDARTFTFEQVGTLAEPLLRHALGEMCEASTLEDLVKDPQCRIVLQERIEKILEEKFSSFGLKIIRVSSPEFSGKEYEELEARLGDAEMARREAEYKAALERVLRKIHDQAEKETRKSDFDLREYKELLDNEYRVNSVTREREFLLLKRTWEHDDIVYRQLVEIEGLQHRHDVENKTAEHELAKNRKIDEYRHGKAIADAQVATQVQKLQTDQNVEDAKKWLNVRSLKESLSQKAKEEEASRRKGMSLNELLLDVEDPGKRTALLEALRIQRNSSMTPDQILAELGKESTNERLVSKLEELFHAASEREDKNLSKMLEPAIEAAKRPTQAASQIIT